MSTLLEPLAPAAEFPANGSPGLTIEALRDATASMRNLAHLDHGMWRMLDAADRTFLKDFTLRSRQAASKDDAAYAQAKLFTGKYPEDVFDFVDAKAELRVAVLRLASKDEWDDALADPKFVSASERGIAALDKGRVKRVRREEL